MQSSKRICPHCGHENIARANFCGYCGKDIFSAADETVKVNLDNEPLSLGALPEVRKLPEKEKPSAVLLGGIFVGIIVVGFILLGILIGDKNPFKGRLSLESAPQDENILIPTIPKQLETFPESTVTITPTPTTTSTPLPPAGIGVSRGTLQTVFTNLGFAFHEADPLYNQPRLIGVSIDRKTSIELSGPPPELIKVTLYMGDSYVGDQALVNQGYILHLLKHIMPHWQEGKTWIAKNIKQLQEEKTQVGQRETIVELIKVTVSKDTVLDLMVLSFEGIYSLEK